MVDIIRPDGDITVTRFEDEGGATTDLYQSIDESVASDSDYIISQKGVAEPTYIASLEDIADPTSSSGHILRYRYKKDASGGNNIDITVAIKQGSTYLETATHSAIGTSWVDGTFTLTAGEADGITDYDDLRFEIIVDAGYDGDVPDRRAAQVSFAEFQLPDPVTQISITATATGTASLATLIGKVLAVGATGTVSLAKSLSAIAISAAATATASLGKGFIFAKTLSATATATAVFRLVELEFLNLVLKLSDTFNIKTRLTDAAIVRKMNLEK